jgi:glycerol-3-phosphate dehydrogenase
MADSLRRADVLREMGATAEWDVLIIGGGATGLGAAVESASRGYRTLLLEAHDFAKGTSSRSTKLLHGGVRYLQQGNLKLVLEALRERGRILRNAPHLSHRQAFVIPAYGLWELPFYGAGLTVYDMLAGRERLGRSRILSRVQAQAALPTVKNGGLKGGVLYYDGQFDDARLAIALLRTVFDWGGVALNYAPVCGLLKRNGRVAGVIAEDSETRSRFEVGARVVINATGVFADSIRKMDEPEARAIVTVSQGTHVVLPRSFLPGDSALMIPRTSDGRVLFAIPWHDRVVVGTTDDPVPSPDTEPAAMPDEKKFLLAHVAQFLGRKPGGADIQSVWSGQRPLVRREGAASTAALSRDHTILVSESKMITITGGKWTTYRRMGEDVIDRAAALGNLTAVASRTAELKLHGWSIDATASSKWERVYGADLAHVREIANENGSLGELLHPQLPIRRSEVVWAMRKEMARRVEDVLARRTRALFLDARASWEAAPETARLMAGELGKDARWERDQVSSYRSLAERYMWTD